MDPSAKEKDIIIIIIITVMATLGGKKEDKYTIGYTHNWRFVTKKANMLRHAGKRDAKI